MPQAWASSRLSGPVRPQRASRPAASAQRPARPSSSARGMTSPSIGSQLEDAGELGLAVGLAAELAVDRRAVLVQRPVIGPGGDQAVEIPEGLGPALGLGAVDDAVSLEVEDLLPRAEPLGLLVIGGGLVELVGPGPRAGPAGVQEPVIGPGGDQAVEVPDRREGVAVLLGLADHRLVPGGIVIELHGGGIEPAELLEPLAPGRGVEPRDRQARSPCGGPCGPRFAASGRRGSRPGAARERARCGIRRTRRWRRPTGHRT